MSSVFYQSHTYTPPMPCFLRVRESMFLVSCLQTSCTQSFPRHEYTYRATVNKLLPICQAMAFHIDIRELDRVVLQVSRRVLFARLKNSNVGRAYMPCTIQVRKELPNGRMVIIARVQ